MPESREKCQKLYSLVNCSRHWSYKITALTPTFFNYIFSKNQYMNTVDWLTNKWLSNFIHKEPTSSAQLGWAQRSSALCQYSLKLSPDLYQIRMTQKKLSSRIWVWLRFSGDPPGGSTLGEAVLAHLYMRTYVSTNFVCLYLWFWMRYLSEIYLRHSWNVCGLFLKHSNFFVCLSVC